MNRLTNKDCYKYEDFCFNYRNEEFYKNIKKTAKKTVYFFIKTCYNIYRREEDIYEQNRLCRVTKKSR